MNTKEEILLRLRQNEGYLSGEQLSEALGVSRAAVWKAITSLRDAGYEIDSATNRGYRLVSSPDVLTPEEVGYGLQTKTLGAKIFAFAEVDSTNEEAKRQAQCGAPDGSVFIAERQTGGKGRLGRAWKSPEGTGIWFSILLRPSLLPTEISNITLLAGIAVCRAVRSVTGCEACIKWPNDVVIGSRKICGILTELAAEIDRNQCKYGSFSRRTGRKSHLSSNGSWQIIFTCRCPTSRAGRIGTPSQKSSDGQCAVLRPRRV